MSEFLAAYETILRSRRTTSSSSPVQQRVTLACEEATTVGQLRQTHTVYTIQILYQSIHDNQDINHNREVDEVTSSTEPSTEQTADLSNSIVYKLFVHKDDSISDIKHAIQEQYGRDWGLTTHSSWNHPDRYGLALGWELVLEFGDVGDEQNQSLEILGNHWFLDTYSIEHGDWIYAIIQRS